MLPIKFIRCFVQLLSACTLLFCCGSACGQAIGDQELLELYKGLRVADVSDGMDMVGLPDSGLMDREIVPLWKDTDNMSHHLTGIALTARYVPTNRPVKTPMGKEEFQKWESQWYTEISGE